MVKRLVYPFVEEIIPKTQSSPLPNPRLFLSPAKPGKLIWSVGPLFVLPTAAAEQLGQGKFSLRPSVVVLTTPGHWVIEMKLRLDIAAIVKTFARVILRDGCQQSSDTICGA